MLEQLKALALSFPPELWIIFSAILVISRFTLIPSRQMTLATLGAITLSIFLTFNLIEAPDFFMQFVVFSIFTLAWSLALLLPMTFYDYWMGRFHHLKGETCHIVQQDLLKNKKGFAKIEDNIMRVKMQPDSAVPRIPLGDPAHIVNTQGALLLVEPTSVPLPSNYELEKYRKHLKQNPLQSDL